MHHRRFPLAPVYDTCRRFAGLRTVGYKQDDTQELDRIITQAADPDVRVARVNCKGQLALVNLALPPVRAHVFLLFMKKLEADAELRVYVYDVQNH